MEAAEIKASLKTSPMGEVLKNERQARALAPVPEAEREEVLKAAAETGAVTAKSITEAAQAHAATNGTPKPAKPEAPPVRYDSTNYVIPEKILEDWDRATEKAREMLSPLSNLRSGLKKAFDSELEDRDVIYA